MRPLSKDTADGLPAASPVNRPRPNGPFEVTANRGRVPLATASTKIIRVPGRWLERRESASAMAPEKPLIYRADGAPYITLQADHPSATEEIAFAELEDGSFVELIRDPDNLKRT